ncbi:helix-turn-helix domain-containing protein [Pseudomonas aeruginosa]
MQSSSENDTHVAAGNSIRKTAEAFGVNPSTVQRAMKAE